MSESIDPLSQPLHQGKAYQSPGQNDDFLKLPEMQQIGRDWPDEGRLVGIDFGTVRIGLSICDPSRTWISPLTTYNRRNERLDAKFFSDLVPAERINAWVLGLPIHCDGNESGKSAQARQFAVWLFELTHLPIRFFDERYTTKLATQMLSQGEFTNKQRKKRIDRIAAHLILEHFIENERAKHSAKN